MTGKRRIRHHDVGLLQKFDALLAPEVSVSTKLLDVSVFIFAVVNELDAVPVLLVACSDKLLKAQKLEVNLKILDEVRLSRVIAVAIYYFVFEVVFIMT